MTLDQIITFYKNNIQDIPPWFGAIFWHGVAAVLVVSLLAVLVGALVILFKAASNTNFKGPLFAIFSFTRNLLTAFIKGSFEAIESPVERPKAKLVILGLVVIHSWLMFIIFSFLLVLLIVLSSISPSAVGVGLKLGQIGLVLLMFYLAAFFWAEKDRDWLAFKSQLNVVKNLRK